MDGRDAFLMMSHDKHYERVFVIDHRLPERHWQLDEVEQASVKLIKDMWCAISRRQHILPVSALSVDALWLTRWRQFVTVAFISTPTWARELTYSEPSRGVHRTPPVATDSLAYTANHIPDAGSSLVLSRLDYGNGVLVDLPADLVSRLQSVLNASALMIFQLRRSDHITDALACLRVNTTRSTSILRSLCWRVKFFMVLHRVTWGRSSVCPIYRVSIFSALPALIA